MGGGSLYLSPQEGGLGAREAVRDVARVLSGYVHAVVIRTFRHHVVEEFARWAAIPVINGLTDAHHPCQGLTDVFTVGEHFGATGGGPPALCRAGHTHRPPPVPAGAGPRARGPPHPPGRPARRRAPGPSRPRGGPR